MVGTEVQKSKLKIICALKAYVWSWHVVISTLLPLAKASHVAESVVRNGEIKAMMSKSVGPGRGDDWGYLLYIPVGHSLELALLNQ